MIVGISMNVVLFSFGLFITQQKIDSSSHIDPHNIDGMLIGEVTNDVKRTGKSIKLNVDIIAVKDGDDWFESSGRALIYMERDSSSEVLKAGDKIIFTPELSEISNRGNPEEFDYKKYLEYNLIYTSDYLSSNEWKLLKTENNFKIRHRLLHFRTKLVNTLRDQGLTNDELAVISALALGYKDELSNEIRHSYSSSGAMHILAVSGLHVGIVYGVLLFLLSFIKNKKYNILKVVIIIAFIWLYAMLTGLSPSVARASVMFSIAALGSLQKHSSSSINSVAASAFLLLTINPLNLVDIGFQMSYLAVIGIIVIQPYIYNIFTVRNKFLDKLWSLTAISVAAQLATVPVAIYYFHQFSNYFLIANYILIPVSTIAIWMCIIVFIFSGIGFLSVFFTKVLAIIMKFMNEVTIIIESLPYSVSDNIYINLPQLLLIYAVIILLFVFFFISKKYKYLIAPLVSLILFSGINLYDSLVAADRKNIIIYNINKTTAINIIDGRDNIIFFNSADEDIDNIKYIAKNNWLRKKLREEQFINLSLQYTDINNESIFLKNKFIGYNDIKMFVLDKSFVITDDIVDKIKLDFIILSDNPVVKLEEISEVFDYKKIIIDSSNSNYAINKWLEENKQYNYSIFNVKERGAFILEL